VFVIESVHSVIDICHYHSNKLVLSLSDPEYTIVW